jgi:hypothetical protein
MAKQPVSEVWKHFEKDDENSSAICNLCQTVVKAKCSSTTNLHAHLKRHHKIELSTVTTVVAKKKKSAEVSDDDTN